MPPITKSLKISTTKDKVEMFTKANKTVTRTISLTVVMVNKEKEEISKDMDSNNNRDNVKVMFLFKDNNSLITGIQLVSINRSQLEGCL